MDLRQNPGGLLDRAIEIASLFLPNNSMILQVEDRDGNRQEMKSTSSNQNPEYSTCRYYR